MEIRVERRNSHDGFDRRLKRKKKKCKSDEKDRTVRKGGGKKKSNAPGIEKAAEEIELIASIRINQRS